MSRGRVDLNTRSARGEGIFASKFARHCDAFLKSRGLTSYGFAGVMKAEIHTHRNRVRRQSRADSIAEEIERSWQG